MGGIAVLVVLLAVLWGGILMITLVNLWALPRLRALPLKAGETPLVSVCIPARDEAAVIRQTVLMLLAQDHPAFEVIVLDDGSTDNTAATARLAADRDPRLRVINGKPLPGGWLGKNWACQQLAAEARGRILVFTDADVRWNAGALHALTGMMARTDADLLTVWPTQITESWGERLVVPLIAFVILGYLPIPAVQRSSSPALAAANGQCLAFRRKAYDRIGGHMAVRASIIEDIQFARLIKGRGLRLRMADGAGWITCRMYRRWDEVRDGFAKNIIAGYGGLVPFALGVLFHWLILLVPWGLLVAGAPTAGAIFIACGISVRLLTAVATRQRALDAVLLPISALLMTIIAAQALVWHLRGGPRWKGRVATVT